jgi:TPR repeat protein
LYSRACERGSREACFELWRLSGREVTREGAAWLEKGCRLGHAESCYYLADEIEESQRGPARRIDPSRLHLTAERAEEAARRRPAPTPTPEPTPEPVRLEGDRQHVLALLVKACDADDGCVTLSSRACTRLGGAYLRGRGVPADVQRGLDYLGRACQGGDPTACHALASFLSDGELTAREPGRALALREAACAEGIGCVDLAGLYERGEDRAPRDPDRALALYRWACDDHDPKGCDAVERLTGSRP